MAPGQLAFPASGGKIMALGWSLMSPMGSCGHALGLHISPSISWGAGFSCLSLV